MTYNLFISHSWTYSDAYQKLTELLKNASYFTYNDFSVPKDDPIHTSGSDRELYNAIYNKIRLCNCVLILSGVYASYSKWIDKEIQICKNEFQNKKPIIGISPWGQKRDSIVVVTNADIMVGWNTASIVDAIRKYSV
jgi:hypothetical protein